MLAEAFKLWRLALPLVAAYLAEFAMFLSTKLIVGKLGYRELATVGIAGDIVFELAVVLIGFLSVVGVLIAQSDGAGNQLSAGKATAQGLLLATLLAIPTFLLILHTDSVLALLGQKTEVVSMSGPFLSHLALMIFPLLWFSVLRSFVTAMSHTGIIMLITIAAVAINYGLATALVHGQFGLPRMGLAGAGLALNLANWMMFVSLLIYVLKTSAFQPYKVFDSLFNIDVAQWREIMTLGIPVAGLVILEAGLFMALSILSGVISTETLASSQVLMGWVGIPFVIAYGVANAAMIRVANGIGKGSRDAAKRSGYCALISGTLLLIVLSIVPLALPEFIIGLFLRPDDPGKQVIGEFVSQLLILVAFFQVFDGIQVISSHALRGLRDTLAPLWIAAVGYWLIGIGGGSILAFRLDWGLTGLWVGLASGLTVTGTLLAFRFMYLVRRQPLSNQLS